MRAQDDASRFGINPPVEFAAGIDRSGIDGALVGVESSAHHDELFRKRRDRWVKLQRQRIIRQRTARPQHNLSGILVHHLHNEFGGRTRLRVNMWLTFLQWWQNIWPMVMILIDAVARPLQMFASTSLD